jgi:Ca2+/Na+ antiporter
VNREKQSQDSRHHWVRDADAGDSIEILLVAAVGSILGIRAFLAATGYPQIGGGGLHIAHMLWGGFFMLAALVLLFRYWNPSLRRLAAVLGGVGFGTFIDELGKFITSDNDYFYQPTVALLYVLFMLLFLLVRAVRRAAPLSPREQRVNDQLRAHLEDAGGPRAGRYFELRNWLGRSYRRIALHRGFEPALIAGFVAVGLGDLLAVAGVAFFKPPGAASVRVVEAASSIASSVCIWIGILALRKSRVAAFRWFQRSMLVSIFVTQVFLFYDSQFGALGGLALHVAIYVALRFAIGRETSAAAGEAGGPQGEAS